MAISTYLANVWSATDFGDPELSGYAESQMREDTRLGVQTMALLSLILQLVVLVLLLTQDIDNAYLYTNVLLGIFSLHILISAAFLNDTRTLHVLGMAFLIIGAVAITFLAHRAGDLNVGMIASIIMLIMVMPLVPWGLREASIIVGLTYFTFTFSFLSVGGKFDTETLWTVQFLIIASAATATLTIVRNTVVRKDDILARYELEDAHRELQLISTRDPLTGAWNRRFLEQNFDDYAQRCFDAQQKLQFAVLDIDRFKHVNDTYGHHHGDMVLQHLATIFIAALPGNTYLIRLGGDEFAILYSGTGLEQLIERCLNHLSTDPKLLEQSSGEPITVTVGLAIGPTDKPADLTTLYQEADKALYEAKAKDSGSTAVKLRIIGDLARTGSMRVRK